MLAILPAIVLTACAEQGISEFFPLKAGTKWTYLEKAKFDTLEYVDEVKQGIKIGERYTIPVETRANGKVLETRHYQIEGDTVLLVAYSSKLLLEPPQPVLKSANGKVSWTYAGKTPFLGAMVPIELKATVTPKGKRKVLDTDRECIELNMDAKMYGGAGMTIDFHQVALYAKGVGLVEVKQRQRGAGESSESSTRLTRFEPAS